MSALEIVSALLGLVNVTLVVRRSFWNYPFGLAMVVLYGLVFARERLYSDALLQVFFLVAQCYGWWNWARSRTRSGVVVVVTLPARERMGWVIGAGLASVSWGYAMHRFTDAALPFADAAIAIVSVVAQVLQSRRVLESWWLWIAVDIGSVALYAAKGLWPTCVLYGVFLGLAIWGLRDWRKVARA